MKKKFFFAAMALVALASCSSDDLVGENNNSPNLNPAPASGEKAIVFNSGTNTITRNTHYGSEAAGMLDDKFVFAGTKGVNGVPASPSVASASYVFDNYTAKYVNNTAHTTESNSDNWEYVGTTAVSPSTIAGNMQTIKYWDYAESQYDFVAYSLGKGFDDDNNASTAPKYATATAIDKSDKSYTLTGSADALKACYISDLVTAYNKKEGSIVANDFGNVVQFSFRSLATKIRIAFYETIPGYSVKDVLFYESDAASTTTDIPTLYASSDVLPTGEGTMTVSFNTTGWANSPLKANATDYNKAHVSFAPKATTDLSANVNFGKLLNYPSDYEGALSTGSFIGRTSNTATYADGYSTGTTPNTRGYYYTILPKENTTYVDGSDTKPINLKLRIKYTLVSTDGSAEEIVVDNATAMVPAELAKWSPNYAYTYIFKISDMTNGSTGQDGSGNIITGLTPITLNAVVVDSEDGLQETITTVATPSITTYTKGKVVTTQSEYSQNANIYIIVNNGTSNVTLTPGTNAWLYTATLEDEAAQTLNEASVDNALHYGTYNSTAKTYTVHDANAKDLVLTDVTVNKQTTADTEDLFQAISQIAADDSPTGNLITVTGAKFYPEAAGKYVFAYRVSEGSATATTAAYNANATYYSMTKTQSGFYPEVAPATVAADAPDASTWESNKSRYTTNPTQPVYAYKIIIVL